MEPTIAAAPDFSVYGLVMHADPVVKGVMIVLLFASIGCWAIILEKIVRLLWLGRDVRALRRAEHERIDLSETRGIARDVLAAREQETEEAEHRHESRNEFRSRLEHGMRAALKAGLHRVEVGLPFLATVGSAAPFIGLFGTVWGIVNSFTSIAQQKDTSLAVVAPGIAEALIATALGLAAAIPAVIAYNQIAVSLGRASAKMSISIHEIARKTRLTPEPVVRSAEQVVRAPEPIRAGRHY